MSINFGSQLNRVIKIRLGGLFLTKTQNRYPYNILYL